jgi:5-methylcytosine-specific restriction enzyme A
MVCRDCGEELAIDRFSRNGRKDGYRRPECRSCQHQRSKLINPNYQLTLGHLDSLENHREAYAQIMDIHALKMQLIATQDSECTYCDTKITLENCDLDHIHPLSQGGKNTIGNLQALCGRCNKEKHAKGHKEYLLWLRSVGEFRKASRTKLAALEEEKIYKKSE